MKASTPELQQQLKIAKQRKGEIARQFKQVMQGSPEHSELLKAMQAITADIKALEARQDKIHSQETATASKTPPLYRIDPNQQWHGDFIVRELKESETSQWQLFLQQQQNIPVYALPVWFDIIHKSFGHRSGVLAAVTAEGVILGGIPLVYFASRLFGHFAVSMPYFNYGGVISPYFNVAQQLLADASALCHDEQLSHIEVRTMQSGLAPHVSSKKVSMILPLPDSTEQLDKQLGAKVRAQFKKAEDHQPQFTFGKLELLKDFYQVFATNMRDLGTPVYSQKWFANILQNDAIQAHLAIVYIANKPVAAGFLIGHNGILEIPWASTLKSANHQNANMWMYRQILGFAIKQGYQFFDFGRSTKEAGTYKFKKQWGAEPYEHYWYYALAPDGQMPGLNPDNPKFKLMIGAWKLLPVWLTKILGPPIVSQIP